MLHNFRVSIKSTLVLTLVILLMALPVITDNSYHLQIMVMVGLNVIIALGMRIIMTTGQVSFAQPGFMAVGGYMSAVLVMRVGISYWLSLVIVILFSALLAFSVGRVALRIKGPYFFLASWALGEVLITLLHFSKFSSLLGGPQGISGIPPPDPVGVFGSSINSYYHGIFLTLLLVFLSWGIDRTRFVKIFFSIRQADDLAESVGINIMKYKVIAFIIGSVFAAIVGVFYAHYVSYIGPASFPFMRGMSIVAYCIVGGIGNIVGPILGATILTLLPEIVRAVEIYEPVIYGIALILTMHYLPDGLISLPLRLSPLLEKWRSRSPITG